MNRLNDFLNRLSLTHILLWALAIRLLAAFFSKGYAFSDDQFEMVELAQDILRGTPPWKPGEVYIFNLIYPYSHILVFGFCDLVGWHDPQVKMLVIRLIQAFYGVLPVYLTYKIAVFMGKEQAAKSAALLAAFFWIFPFMCVRSLREFVCIVPLLAAFYWLHPAKENNSNLVLAGFMLALAMVLRIQTLFFPFGIAIAMLITQRWKALLILGFSALFGFMLTQGLFDWLLWGNPLASVLAYVDYNLHHSGDYPNGPWFMYIGTVLGIALPFLSLFMAAGYLKSWKLYPEMLAGSLAFFVFHSAFPNKQERFILPFFPFFLLLGTVALYEIYGSGRWKATRKWLYFSIYLFLVINIPLCVLLSLTYTKRSRVETMTILSQQPRVKSILFASGGGIPFPPVFYLNKKNVVIYQMPGQTTVEDIKREMAEKGLLPDYVVITGNQNLDEQLSKVREIAPLLQHVADVSPSFIDMAAFYLNPRHNVNETWHIYRVIISVP